MFSCIFDSFDHALDSSVTKAARYDYAVAAVEHFSYSVLIEIFRLYPLDINFCAVLKTAVTESFCYGKISVLKLNILANKTAVRKPYPSILILLHIPNAIGIRKVSQPNTKLFVRFFLKSSISI